MYTHTHTHKKMKCKMLNEWGETESIQTNTGKQSNAQNEHVFERSIEMPM